jgi:nicotinamidase/pyrazinamidase
MSDTIKLSGHDVLIVTDMQNDFLPGGKLAIKEGDTIIPALNRTISKFKACHLPVVATRDWHPENHMSFKEQGGPWPPHCIRNTEGAEFTDNLKLPDSVKIVSKATEQDKEAYSSLKGTDLPDFLKSLNTERVFIGGVATEYCVRESVMDLLQQGYMVYLLQDAIKAVNLDPEDGLRAFREMVDAGAKPIDHSQIA